MRFSLGGEVGKVHHGVSTCDLCELHASHTSGRPSLGWLVLGALVGIWRLMFCVVPDVSPLGWVWDMQRSPPTNPYLCGFTRHMPSSSGPWG